MNDNKAIPANDDPAGSLESLRSERDQFKAMAQRTQADFDNYQKRNARDREEERRYALMPLAKDLLPALDNLDRALVAVKEPSALSEGVHLVRQQLLETLKRHGVTPIDAVGRPFDPHQHDAVLQQPAPDKPPGTVLQVLESGYRYHDRVLRPSKVIVSTAG